MTSEQQSNFSSLIQKYSGYLKQNGNREQLLALGQELFGSNNNPIVRPSYSLLQQKEKELSTPIQKQEQKTKFISNKTQIQRQDAQQQITPEQIFENVLFLQDRNSLLLARKHALEVQSNDMQNTAGKLMEQSVQQKVRLSLQMEKLKAELSQALSRSRPDFATKAAKSSNVIEELSQLNDQILFRINSFKMAISDTAANAERAVLDRYKPHMEQILGQIYSHSEYLPVSEVMEKFNTESENVEHEMREKETELHNEHERNDQLQKEANQLGDLVAEQQEEVNRLKLKNAQLHKEISLLDTFAEEMIKEMHSQYEQLLDVREEDETVIPTSARAVTVTTGNERRTIKRSGSRTFYPSRDGAIPQTRDIEEFIEIQKSALLKKITQA